METDVQPTTTAQHHAPEPQHLPHRLAGIHDPTLTTADLATSDRLDRIVGIVCGVLFVLGLVAAMAGWLE